MSCLIAIETSTENCSVALLLTGEVHSRALTGVKQHAAHVLPLIDELLSAAGISKTALDAIAYGQGPGAFTGVRLAVAVAQGLGFALDRPVIGISSLHATAAVAARRAATNRQASNALHIALLDARMGEFYVGAFRESRMLESGAVADTLIAIADEQVLSGAALAEWLQAIWLDHSAVRRLPNADVEVANARFSGYPLAQANSECAALWSNASHDGSAAPDASEIVRLAALAWKAGEAKSAEFAQPSYVRNKVADTTHERLIKRQSAAANL